MEHNPYEAPKVGDPSQDQPPSDGAPRTPSSTARLLSIPLFGLVAIQIIPLLMFRIESDGELIYVLIIDLISGIALHGAIALNLAPLARSRKKRRRVNVAILTGACLAAALMAWHLDQFYIRRNVAREMMERQSGLQN